MAEQPSSAGSHRASIEESRRKWDGWSSRDWFWRVYEADTREKRSELVAALDLQPGDAVVDVGCGGGANFELLRDVVGPAGYVLGIDLSPGMLDRAETRIAEHGWTNVETCRADATRLPVEAGRFDGAVATTAVSSTPDVPAVVANVHDALRPGSRFGVYEIRLVPSGPARALNPLIHRFYRRVGNWNEECVLDALRATFDETRVLETFALGSNYLAVAEKRGES